MGQDPRQDRQRRQLLKAAALAAPATLLAAGTAQAQFVPPQATPGRSFVLVHGAWHGAWCWRRVADALIEQGHKVYTPTLTGLADRSHLLSAQINLDTHILDIANLFKWEEISSAILVGHSYGGWPVSGALEKIGDRVASVVFLDAFLPKNGQSGLDIQTPTSQGAVQEALKRGEISRPAPPASTFKFRRKSDEEWVARQMTAQPIGVSTQPIVLTGARERMRDKYYLRAARYPNPVFDGHLADCRADTSWKTSTLDSGHDVMIDAPELLLPILGQIAGAPALA